MLLRRLGLLSSNLHKIKRTNLLVFKRCMSEKLPNLDQPIPYSSSKAATWKAQYNRVPPTEMVWYTPYVVIASVTVFMLHFLVFREENDLDELVYRPLPETLEGIDKLFPNIDFYTKPDYVRYHEEQAKNKNA